MLKKIRKWLLYATASILILILFLLSGIFFNWFGVYQGPGKVLEFTNTSPLYEELSKERKNEVKKILFGDLHVHTTYSWDAYMLNLPIAQGEGAHPVSDACNFARICSNLDFFAVTDHAEWLTKREWKDSLKSIQECKKVTDDLDEPPIVPFLGWEWTQTSLDKDTHFGHKNIILKSTITEDIPPRPIAAVTKAFDGGVNSNTLITSAAVALDFPNRKQYFNWRYRSLIARSYEDCDMEKEISHSANCYEKAETASDLFKKLEKFDSDLLVIPHGSAWGVTSPPFSSWDVQLNPDSHNANFNKLLEIYSGHGNSEEYRSWTPMQKNNNETLSCSQPSQDYLPDCFQAGEIIKERCRVSAGSNEECNQRAEKARKLFIESDPFGLLTIPGYDPMEWKDSGQCKDCFLPAFDYRPKMSAQYALALTDFSTGTPIRFRYGFIGSSDNHQARPGTGYKENLRKLNTESRADLDNEIGRYLLNPRLLDPKLPLSQEIDTERDKVFMNSMPLQSERGSSFLYSGGLVAVHAALRNREEIWSALSNREVYATSGERILLWFNLINHPQSEPVPMGTETEMSFSPKFVVKAIGAQKQLPGCSSLDSEEISSEALERLCRGECFNPSNERKLISRIEVVRIRPQVYKDEPIDGLIQDPWKTFECKNSQEGCEIEFMDEQFEGGNREIIYYVRAVQEPSEAINASGLDCNRDENGKCLKINLCGDPKGKGKGDCLSLTEERAWSSPIFVKFKSNSP